MEENYVSSPNETQESARSEIMTQRKKKQEKGKNPKTKKRIVVILLTLLLLIAVAGAGFFLWKNRVKHKESAESQTPKDLVSQYKDQLGELKEKAQSGNPQDIQNYAIAQYATGDAKGAEESYRKQIEKSGDSATVRNNLGNALRDQKKFEDAINEYKEAINKDKSLISAYLNMGSIYQYSLQDPAKAVDVYKQGIENNQKNVDLRIFLAQVYEQIKDTENAKDTYRGVLEIQSENAAAKAGLKRLGE